MEAFRPTSQDRGVAGFQAKDRTVDGDVGPSLVDDTNYPDGHATLFDNKSIGTSGGFQGGTDGIGQGGNLSDRFGELFEARRSEGESIDLGGSKPIGRGVIQVLLVRAFQRFRGGGDDLSEFGQGCVFLRGRNRRQHMRCSAGALGDSGYKTGEFIGHSCRSLI